MNMRDNKTRLQADIEAVITSCNQGSMLLEAVQSVCNQTVLPQKIILVDDGSTDSCSLDILNTIETDSQFPVPITIHFQENKGVSAARNAGIRLAQSSMVLILDGDDKLEAEYMKMSATCSVIIPQWLRPHPGCILLAFWMQLFVPAGVISFLFYPIIVVRQHIFFAKTIMNNAVVMMKPCVQVLKTGISF